MHVFGSHTFSLINANNERYWVKSPFKTQQGIKNLTDAEAEALIAKDRESHQRGDHYTQPGRLFRLNKEQLAALFGNTARAIGNAPTEIKIRHIGNCSKADPEYGKGVAQALGIPMSEVPAK